jgi:recombination protein RecT
MTQNLPAKKPVDTLKAIINSDTVKEQFQNAMGKHADLFTASLIDVFNSGLQDCEPSSVVTEALKAAVLKLPISKSLGFAYLVPYKQKYKDGNKWKEKKVATFQMGYKGLIQLAMRSGQVSALNGGPVFEGELKKNDRMTGIIDISGEATSDKVVGYFVYMELVNGFKKSEYWTKEKVLAHAKEKSQSYQADLKYKSEKSAWFTDFDAMATKTVLKSMLSKYAPMSIDFIAAMSSDDSGPVEQAEPETIDITPETEKKTKKKKDPAEKKPDVSKTETTDGDPGPDDETAPY